MKQVKEVLMGVLAFTILFLSFALVIAASPFLAVAWVVISIFEWLRKIGKRLQEDGSVSS